MIERSYHIQTQSIQSCWSIEGNYAQVFTPWRKDVYCKVILSDVLCVARTSSWLCAHCDLMTSKMKMIRSRALKQLISWYIRSYSSGERCNIQQMHAWEEWVVMIYWDRNYYCLLFAAVCPFFSVKLSLAYTMLYLISVSRPSSLWRE